MTRINPNDLRSAYLFSALSEAELETLAAQVDIKKQYAGELIFRHNDSGDSMFIVQQGVVNLFVKDRTGIEISVLQVQSGQVFGELSLLDRKPRSASARAMTDVTLLVIRRDALVNLNHQHPLVALRMLEILAARLRSSSHLLQDRTIPNCNEAIEVSLSLGDRISDLFTGLSGNIIFVTLSLVWFVIWIVWNLDLVPGLEPFDPFPFGFLTMVVSLEMVFLSLFILIKQSRMAAHDKVRNDVEYEVNVRAEMGIRSLSESIEVFENRTQLRLDHMEQAIAALSRNGDMDAFGPPNHPVGNGSNGAAD